LSLRGPTGLPEVTEAIVRQSSYNTLIIASDITGTRTGDDSKRLEAVEGMYRLAQQMIFCRQKTAEMVYLKNEITQFSTVEQVQNVVKSHSVKALLHGRGN